MSVTFPSPYQSHVGHPCTHLRIRRHPCHCRRSLPSLPVRCCARLPRPSASRPFLAIVTAFLVLIHSPPPSPIVSSSPPNPAPSFLTLSPTILVHSKLLHSIGRSCNRPRLSPYRLLSPSEPPALPPHHPHLHLQQPLPPFLKGTSPITHFSLPYLLFIKHGHPTAVPRMTSTCTSPPAAFCAAIPPT